MYDKYYRWNYVNDAACLMMGFYKGALESNGVHANTAPIVYAWLTTSALRGMIGARAGGILYFFDEGKWWVEGKHQPTRQGLKECTKGTMISALELAVGYGAGWGLGKLLGRSA